MLRRSLKFWTKEHSLSALLAILVVQLFVPVPTVGGGLVLRLAADVALSMFLVAGLLTMARRRLFMFCFVLLVIAGTIVHSVRLIFDFQVLAGWDFLFSMLGLAGVLMVTLKMVYQDGPVTKHRIRGAIAAYLMIAAIFGKVYSLISYLIPGAFSMNEALAGLSIGGDDFLYFSVVALTTIGFGDITPVASIARSFVMVEGFIGQLYPAILIARLVSLSLVSKQER